MNSYDSNCNVSATYNAYLFAAMLLCEFNFARILMVKFPGYSVFDRSTLSIANK